MEKINIFGENLLKKYSKIGVLIFQKYSKIEVIYEVKIWVAAKLIQNRGFTVYKNIWIKPTLQLPIMHDENKEL